MAELKRREDQLTTADLAGRTEESRREVHDIHDIEEPNRPRLVRREDAEPRAAGVDSGMGEPHKLRTPAAPRTDPRDAASPANRQQDVKSPAAGTNVNEAAPLFSAADIGDLRGRWSNIQADFVDEPRRSVEEADKLVATVMQRLAEGFANERSNLEKQWDRGDSVSTEDLRVALQRYRSFFDRLLNA